MAVLKISRKRQHKELVNDKQGFIGIQNAATFVRDADAMSSMSFTPDGGIIMHNGNYVKVQTTPLENYNTVPISEETEINGIIDKFYSNDGKPILDVNGNHLEVNNDFSKGIHAGEVNTRFVSDFTGDSYKATASIVNPLATPIHTVNSIFERVAEVATYGHINDRTFNINLPKEIENTNLGIWYNERVNELKTDMLSKAKVSGFFTDGLRNFKNMVKINYE